MFTLLSFSICYSFLYSFWQRLIHHVNYLKGKKKIILYMSLIHFVYFLHFWPYIRGIKKKNKKKCTILLFLAGGKNLKLYQPLLLLCKPFSYLAATHSPLKRFGNFRLLKNIKLVHTRQVFFHNVKTASLP